MRISRWHPRGLCQNWAIRLGFGLWFFSLFFSGFLIFATFQWWPCLIWICGKICSYRLKSVGGVSKDTLGDGRVEPLGLRIINWTPRPWRHESSKSWPEELPKGRFGGRPCAIFLPELFSWQILTGIEDFEWKSSILARERGAIEEGFLIAIHPSSLLLMGSWRYSKSGFSKIL